MNVVVFGASGKVGQKVVAELLVRGNIVTAFVFGSSPFLDHINLKVIQGNVKNYDNVLQALKGSDVVISTLGSWGTKTKDILSAGMKNIIPAMEAENIKRIISLTGADAHASGDKVGIVNYLSRTLFGFIAGKVLKDGELHIHMLEDSNLEWTVLRSPVMNEKGHKKYLLSNKLPKPWATINRDAVATAMVDLIATKKWIQKTPIISRISNR